MTALTNAKAGETYTIKWMIANRNIMDYFKAMKLEEGQPITLIQDYFGSILVRYQGHIYAISNDAACRIKV